jgi:hypothetical protein
MKTTIIAFALSLLSFSSFAHYIEPEGDASNSSLLEALNSVSSRSLKLEVKKIVIPYGHDPKLQVVACNLKSCFANRDLTVDLQGIRMESLDFVTWNKSDSNAIELIDLIHQAIAQRPQDAIKFGVRLIEENSFSPDTILDAIYYPVSLLNQGNAVDLTINLKSNEIKVYSQLKIN